MSQVLVTLRQLKVRRSTIWLCVAWVGVFVLYLAVQPESEPTPQTVIPVAPVTRSPEPIQTSEVTTTPSTTAPTTTPSDELNRTAPARTGTTEAPTEQIPPGRAPAVPTPTPTEATP